MSLKDTIKGAREEAVANGNPFERAQDKGASTDDGQKSAADQGFTRRSAARSKPSREASAGVRVVSSSGKAKSKSSMSKEEQKAERKRERENEDRRYNVSQMVLEDNPEYQRMHKVWWRFLIAGVIFMVIALLLYVAVSNAGETAPTWMAVASMATMIIAYIILIVGLIYDWRKIRPLRKQADQRVASMSDKKVLNMLKKKNEAQ